MLIRNSRSQRFNWYHAIWVIFIVLINLYVLINLINFRLKRNYFVIHVGPKSNGWILSQHAKSMRCTFLGTLGKALRWYNPSQEDAREFPHRVSSLLSPQRRGSIRGVSLDAGPVCVQQARNPSYESPDNMVSQIVRQSQLGSKPFHTGRRTTVCIQSELTNLRK